MYKSSEVSEMRQS